MLSFIVSARNDNYGGNFLHRIQSFVSSLLTLWQKYSLDAELVIAEWNPPQESPRLKDVLVLPKFLKPGIVRIIEVHSEIHHKLPNSDRMPMFEYIAKNVGIRRARGEFVLSTNPDLLYSEELIRFFAEKKLSKECFYRIDRYDVKEQVPIDLSVEKQLEFCADHTFRIAKLGRTVLMEPLLRKVAHLPRSIMPTMYEKKELICSGGPYRKLRRIHTNASGDFLLIAREGWYAIRGYPELKTNSFIDGYGCFLAAALGLRQVILKNPMRIYHQEHDRSEFAKRPLTDYQQYLEHGMNMLQSKQPEVFNSDGWGLGNYQLPEYGITL